jgi:hypothetical protein
VWKTSDGERIYKTPTGWPLTKKARELADEFDEIISRKMEKMIKQLRKEGYFKMKPGLSKYYHLGKSLQFLKDLRLRSKCDPDLENIWRALYDYAPKLAPRKLPSSQERTMGKRNFFLMCFRLGQLPEDVAERIGSWSNWNDIYMSFVGNPLSWKDWERILGWILRRSDKNGFVDREKLRQTLIAMRGMMGRKSKVKRDTTVLSESELYRLLDSAMKGCDLLQKI